MGEIIGKSECHFAHLLWFTTYLTTLHQLYHTEAEEDENWEERVIEDFGNYPGLER
jgi:hypothetical protein